MPRAMYAKDGLKDRGGLLSSSNCGPPLSQPDMEKIVNKKRAGLKRVQRDYKTATDQYRDAIKQVVSLSQALRSDQSNRQLSKDLTLAEEWKTFKKRLLEASEGFLIEGLSDYAAACEQFHQAYPSTLETHWHWLMEARTIKKQVLEWRLQRLHTSGVSPAPADLLAEPRAHMDLDGQPSGQEEAAGSAQAGAVQAEYASSQLARMCRVVI